ncbi:MAG: SPOR domain-containing protein [Proteobacteria bacterium]|nr:SPOR domain-containing protein [Pseudomonadota bacterium]
MKLRFIFIALVIANLVFFAWANWLRAAPEDAAGSPAPKARRLQLANEAPVVSAAAARRCVTVGPFATPASVERAKQVLADGGYTPAQRQAPGQIIDGYWVYLESPENRAAERRLLARLERGGIRDASPVTDAEFGRRISLGVFSDSQRATAQAQRVSTQGVEAQIVPRERAGEVIWLDIELHSESPDLKLGSFPAVDGSQIEIKPCPTSAAG